MTSIFLLKIFYHLGETLSTFSLKHEKYKNCRKYQKVFIGFFIFCWWEYLTISRKFSIIITSDFLRLTEGIMPAEWTAWSRKMIRSEYRYLFVKPMRMKLPGCCPTQRTVDRLGIQRLFYLKRGSCVLFSYCKPYGMPCRRRSSVSEHGGVGFGD